MSAPSTVVSNNPTPPPHSPPPPPPTHTNVHMLKGYCPAASVLLAQYTQYFTFEYKLSETDVLTASTKTMYTFYYSSSGSTGPLYFTMWCWKNAFFTICTFLWLPHGHSSALSQMNPRFEIGPDSSSSLSNQGKSAARFLVDRISCQSHTLFWLTLMKIRCNDRVVPLRKSKGLKVVVFCFVFFQI